MPSHCYRRLYREGLKTFNFHHPLEIFYPLRYHTTSFIDIKQWHIYDVIMASLWIPHSSEQVPIMKKSLGRSQVSILQSFRMVLKNAAKMLHRDYNKKVLTTKQKATRPVKRTGVIFYCYNNTKKLMPCKRNQFVNFYGKKKWNCIPLKKIHSNVSLLQYLHHCFPSKIRIWLKKTKSFFETIK